jgi:hypothetical protein
METLGRQITAKFKLALQLIEVLGPKLVNKPRARSPGKKTETSAEMASAFRIELQALQTRYALSTSYLFLQAALGESGRVSARDEYQRIVSAENFEGDLDYLVRRIRVELGVGDQDLEPKTRTKKSTTVRTTTKTLPKILVREVKGIMEQYNGHKTDCTEKTVIRSLTTQGVSYGKCDDCGTDMGVNSEKSELACSECGKVRELIGTAFSDAQFYNQEGQKAKSGSFNPNRHFRFWMDRILGKESEEELGAKDEPGNACGEKLLAKLRSIIRRDRKILRFITVDNVRDMLKEVNRTDLNKNVPLIMRKLTGVGPPQLPDAVYQKVEKIFSTAIEIGERIRPPERANRTYYPYYIYKILDAILPEPKNGATKSTAREHRRVLYYIYLQGDDTLKKNDQEWEKICEELPRIDWAPTDRGKAQKYRPV